MKFLLYIFIFSLTLLMSCGILLFRNIECREFASQDELVWFPGNVGDTVIFKKSSSGSATFMVVRKSIYHTLGYKSDTGCGCADLWELILANDSDTLGVVGQIHYVNNNPPRRNDRVIISIDNNNAGFVTSDRSILKSITIGGVKLDSVAQFKYNHPNPEDFNKAIISKGLGIVQLVRNNGEIWTNLNLIRTGTTSIDSFKYSETPCQ